MLHLKYLASAIHRKLAVLIANVIKEEALSHYGSYTVVLQQLHVRRQHFLPNISQRCVCNCVCS